MGPGRFNFRGSQSIIGSSILPPQRKLAAERTHLIRRRHPSHLNIWSCVTKDYVLGCRVGRSVVYLSAFGGVASLTYMAGL